MIIYEYVMIIMGMKKWTTKKSKCIDIILRNTYKGNESPLVGINHSCKIFIHFSF